MATTKTNPDIYIRIEISKSVVTVSIISKIAHVASLLWVEVRLLFLFSYSSTLFENTIK